jgi:hypothetical protein
MNVDYQFLVKRITRELDNERHRWRVESMQTDDIGEYYQMIGVSEGIQKAIDIVMRHLSPGANTDASAD